MRDTRAYRKNQRWGYSQRKVEILEPIQRFLIVCEGQKTEPHYFNGFRVPKDIVELDIRGTGYNTIRLVEKAIELKDVEKYDQVWCVFDRNSHPAHHFKGALELADKNDISVAYSNQSFELWYLLHFDYCDTATHRKDCCRRLNRRLGRRYEKNGETLYDDLKPLQQDAIRNATRLLAQYDPRDPERDNPSTTVHLLVIELNKFIR
jgi:hypothetical protein